MRFGKLSRAPLQLLRLQVWRETAECDWMARSWDEWDAALPRGERDRLASFQALQDAIAIREMLFGVLPDVQAAELRAFRQSAREPPELIIFGNVSREAVPVEKITSPIMRAKLYGLRFFLDEGVLKRMEVGDGSLQLISA
ncbi:MAG TPA: hypothetical protein VHX36_05240 [Candidatus Acidoferrales bacterium]|jgi:hypothetical protein|nr:hypothetical protein [Candidatus Acidoferrales bacterium]